MSDAATIAAGCDAKLAGSMHEQAHRTGFIANPVTFPITCEATVAIADSPTPPG